MNHDHSHPQDHVHGLGSSHHHGHDPSQPLPAALDLSVPEAELSAGQLGRRSFLRRAGLLGAATAGATALGTGAAAASDSGTGRAPGRPGSDPQDLLWLAGDHHIHTNHSPDAQYLVSQQVNKASQYGLDWMVITDHGTIGHQKLGVELTHPEIVQARVDNARTLVFQGFEWNIPAAEHGTVIVAPGNGDVAVLKEFEGSFDGALNNATATGEANEALARKGLVFLQTSVDQKRVSDALFLANHPARNGLDSPHEIRGWRDAAPKVAVGFEGAPGHQAAATAVPEHATNGRGYYSNKPGVNSFPGYPLESYVTYGGFDWMTATVGGLWDSLLAEGKNWWISANSDSHQVYNDTFKPGAQDLATTGSRGAPVDTGAPIASYGDFWPGYYSSTVVGATDFSYGAVMAGIRAGRMYVVHGGLIGALSVQVSGAGAVPGTLGSTVVPTQRGRRVTLQVDIALADRPNYHGEVPVLKKLDVVVGAVTGPVSDRDTLAAPQTSVVKTVEVPAKAPGNVFSFTYDLGARRDPFYVRLRGSDGRRTAVGLKGASVDPSGPKVDALGNADPWADLWFYSNPIFVVPSR